jgi:small subunit ribosomal protein S17
MERNARRTYVGKVVSTGMDKTITVLVETKKEHPIYKKKYTNSKKYKSHDEEQIAEVGDIVKIMETRPLSKTKRTRLVEVVQKAVK